MTSFLVTRAMFSAPLLLDDCDDASLWTAEASDGVSIQIRSESRGDTRCLRIDFDFHRGAGYCVFRRPIDVPLPARYRLRFDIRGEAPSNNLELKLIDSTGDNVWWHNRRGFEFPREWTTLTTRSRHVTFAWGPAGADSRLEHAHAIEFAIAAGSGGKGAIWIDSLTFEELPEPPANPPLPIAHATPEAPGWPRSIEANGNLHWAPDVKAEFPSLTLDHGYTREFGGLALQWASDIRPTSYEVETSDDGRDWRTALHVHGAAGPRDWLPTPDSDARFVRIRLADTSGRPFMLERLRFLEPSQATPANALWRTIAAETREGLLPAYFRNSQRYWTIMGASGDEKEALIDEDGSIEVDKLSFTLAPFVRIGPQLFTAEDVVTEQSLEADYLPIPTVTWRSEEDWRLDTTAFVHGAAGASTLFIRYRLTNETAADINAQLLVAIRPFQALPPTQDLNVTGGTSRITSIELTRKNATVNDSKPVFFITEPDAVGASSFFAGEIGARLEIDQLPTLTSVVDSMGFASGAASYDLLLPPHASRDVILAIPMHDATPRPEPNSDPIGLFTHKLDETAQKWQRPLDRIQLKLPPSADHLVNTFRSTLCYILINRDGPAIQPGSRTYERTWIRDGSLTAKALLYAGFNEEVRDFLDWFAPFQYEDGKVPCCVDARGPDPVTENDSHGQYIHLVAQYFSFTRDEESLVRHMPHVRLAVAHIESLIQQRSTPQYQNATGLESAKYGLVPESISHEGYSAKPMHSYWDCFWTLRGLEDAHTLALAAGDTELAAQAQRLRDGFRESLSRSIAIAMEEKQIEYVPGCVELGDFDASSTSIALFPLNVADVAPAGAIEKTFARYRTWFTDRARGALDWKDYTPYEIRNATSFLLLNQSEFAHEMLDFLFRDQRPQGWNHWAEIVWRDPREARFIGDMPHTWVGSDYVKLVRTMFVHEMDDALHLGMGIDPQWLDDPVGVEIRDFPTPWGPIGYRAHRKEGVTTVELLGDIPAPPGGLHWRLCGDHAGLLAFVDGAAVAIHSDGTVPLKPTARRLELRPR